MGQNYVVREKAGREGKWWDFGRKVRVLERIVGGKVQDS
jgi:hypothetical protein